MKRLTILLTAILVSSCSVQSKHYVNVPKKYKPQIDSLLMVNKAVFFNVYNKENCISLEVFKKNKEVLIYNLK